MRVTAQPAYVLHARAWRETSMLVEAFTRDFGRVGLVARGVRSARARLPRALLEPLQTLRIDWVGRGELQTLTSVEAAGAVPAWRADRLPSAMYVNELLVRLTARNDPQPVLFARYARWLGELAGTPSLAWSLRCFERDLLAAIGYAPRLAREGSSGAAVDPARTYTYVPEQGPEPASAGAGSLRLRGSALLALSSGKMPDAEDRAALRHLLRALITLHLGGRGLQSWRVFGSAGGAD